MKEYWLYLESYTFVFKGRQGYSFYNSVSNQKFLVCQQEKVVNIIERLIDPEQMYCIEISDEDIDKYGIMSFVKKLRDSFAGDLFSKQIVRNKPVALNPKLSIMKSVERLKMHPENSVGQNLMSYLHELNIFLTGNCMLECKSCNIYSKQVTTCIKNHAELSILLLEKLLLNIQTTGLYKINFLGGDILSHDKWKDFCILISNLPFQIKLYAHYKNILPNSEKLKDIAKTHTLCILVPDDFSKNDLKYAIGLSKANNLNIELVFHITSNQQYSKATEFCEEKKIQDFSILPIFIGSNIYFFQQNVFLDYESIFSIPSSKKDIFTRMSLNTNDFGKLSVMSNGDVFSNVNCPKLGNINSSTLYDILYSEILNGKNWLRIRDMEPCNQCVYQWLCPSPSNYEIAIGKPNLCHVIE